MPAGLCIGVKYFSFTFTVHLKWRSLLPTQFIWSLWSL